MNSSGSPPPVSVKLLSAMPPCRSKTGSAPSNRRSWRSRRVLRENRANDASSQTIARRSGSRNGNGAQQHRVDDAEDRSVRADAQREREDRDRGKPRMSPQAADAVSQLSNNVSIVPLLAPRLACDKRASLRPSQSGARRLAIPQSRRGVPALGQPYLAVSRRGRAAAPAGP